MKFLHSSKDVQVDTKEYANSLAAEKDFHSDKEAMGEVMDDSNFSPNRVYYIQTHNLWDKSCQIINITSQVPAYEGGKANKDFLSAAKKVGKAKDAEPAFTISQAKKYTRYHTMHAGTEKGPEIATWDHPVWSSGEAVLAFPVDSKSSSHPLKLTPPKWTRRVNIWVQDSVPYQWKFDSWKSNRMTLYKSIAGVNKPIGRYDEKWTSFGTGGALLIDGKEVDEVVAVLTACSMLQRMQQRNLEGASPGASFMYSGSGS